MTAVAGRATSLPVSALFSDTAVITRRNLIRVVRTPQLLVVTLTSPVLFMALFRYVLGGAIPIPGLRYVDYLVPAMLVQNVVFAGFGGATALAIDAKEGAVDRFRSLPMARTAVLTGRAGTDVALEGLATALTLGAGVLVGFRFHGGALGALAAGAITLVFGFALFWVFAAIAFTTRSAETVQALEPPFFLLLFVSSAFIPVTTLPGWLQAFARNQPISQWTNAIRCLTQGRPAEVLLGHSTGYFVTASLLWCAAVILVFAPLTLHAFRRP
jgi:ABC transporter DrrB family efflux protein